MCWALHLPILQPLISEGALRSSDDLPYVIEAISGITLPSIVWDTGVLVVSALIFLLIFVKSSGTSMALRLRILSFGFAALTLALLLFSKKSWPPYLMLCLFPICLLIRSRLNIAAFALFGVVTVVSHSYWETVLGELTASGLHQGLLARDPRCILFLFIELVLIAFYAWILRLALQQINGTPSQAGVSQLQEGLLQKGSATN
jgi:hypothetical protein